ncbi:hypothetical protein H0A36_17575 [Endozoicomonas sp. SM1973]|uniref:Conjugal transfer protein n=1 Tax=Spartinivicinus marinus TaxID=2994442 RepID=A0A853IE95_9GAMM|nr:RAQPRD family integrative conjugative element protein [Spartinivicinus marinus]MCX4030184.1 RAQPRD family integrative conjugative element protein [Spartinivicinus marinus]NYZ67827.1 hypothetical protein [Spartinivicinus marinus]
MRNYLLILLLAVPFIAYADSAQERALLSTLEKELVFLESKIKEAQRLSSKEARFRFDYQALKNDIAKIKGGISRYLNRPLREPRQLGDIEPVKGGY